MNISDKNLNLLPIFRVIAEERNLSRASKRLTLSQPALSHALSKLRDLFADPLFVRVPHGLVATPRAEQLLPEVIAIVESMDRLFQTSQTDLRTINRNFAVASTNYFELRFLQSLMERMQMETPGVVLTTVSLQGEFPKKALEDGEIDMAIAAYFKDLPEGLRQKGLGTDRHVCVMRRGHPFLQSKQTLSDYLKYGHVVISVPLRVRQGIDHALADLGKERRIVASINNFLTPPLVVTQTDSLLTCPLTLAQNYAKWFALEIVELPVKVAPIAVTMVWHERNHVDPLHRWVRHEIEASLGVTKD